MHIVHKSLDIEGKLGVLIIMFDSKLSTNKADQGSPSAFLESLNIQTISDSMANGTPTIK
jgi:hypothetical protein